MVKTSIRFFNSKEVRAVWDDATGKWWFCAVDVVAALSGSVEPRNYWHVLKNRLKKSAAELLTKCKGFALVAPAGAHHEDRRPRDVHEGHRLLLLLRTGRQRTMN